MTTIRRRTGARIALSGLLASVLVLSGGAYAQNTAAPAHIDMVVFGQPSLGAFLQPVIKARKFDLQNGIDLHFSERTPDAYVLEFNSGEFQVGGSAALLSIGVARTKGIKVSYLFNLFDYFGAVVSSRPGIRSAKDLPGKQLVAATATTNYAMFRWLMQRSAVPLDKVTVQNTATPGLIGYALADRSDAVQLWEPAYSQLLARKPDLHTIDLNVATQWKAFSDAPSIPYLGVAAHDDWIAKNPTLVKELYKTFKDASVWVQQNPKEAAALIAPSLSGSDPAVVEKMIVSNRTLAMDVMPAEKARKGIEAVYKAGLQSGYFKQPVDDASIYPTPLD
ncbi:ABC transporter substrate-binding protein [Paraburkholderia sp. ZP32-5]|uniref:ABC transporter substrate-binding protein n=1 Tax=Paraburkholderia sp. ZP32-5 TaxID=2883245 RepID=UPI001F23CB80|nr:ABC transporter substrate-binding protein [Paraburkholderia sp. ZP32-5]